MTIIFLWTGATGYMAACWRALASRPGVRLKVFVEVNRGGATAYRHEEVLHGLEYHLRFTGDPLDIEALRAEVAAMRPDILVILGWRCRMCRAVAEDAVFAAVPKLFAFDMTFAFTLRKVLARFVLRHYLRRFAGAVVTGERSALYARYLGFDESRIERGLIGLDTVRFGEAQKTRVASGAYPRQFLFVGRYTREKRVDLLLQAYQQYRAQVSDPWPLTCCGMGPDGCLLASCEGVTDLGFVQPGEMPDVFAHHGALVITSDYDPWPLVIAEAAAAALPVICTDACGSHVELVRSYYNGRVCGTGDVDGLAAAMVWMHLHEAALPQMGARGMELVAAFDKDVWASHWDELCRSAVSAATQWPQRRV